MRLVQPKWLIRAFGLAGLAVTAAWPLAAQAQYSDARTCADQT